MPFANRVFSEAIIFKETNQLYANLITNIDRRISNARNIIDLCLYSKDV